MDVQLDKNLYLDMNAKDEDGNYGVYREGVRNPDTHTITFGDPAETTDAAREKAVELGVDINAIAGTGKDGKVTVQDVEKAAKA